MNAAVTVSLVIHHVSTVETTTPSSSPDLSSFLQYGIVGLVALLALGAVRVLYNRDVTQRDAAYAREKDRADRLESELSKLNNAVQTQIFEALSEANKAVADAIAATQVAPKPRGR